jgi:hypothetical protein
MVFFKLDPVFGRYELSPFFLPLNLMARKSGNFFNFSIYQRDCFVFVYEQHCSPGGFKKSHIFNFRFFKPLLCYFSFRNILDEGLNAVFAVEVEVC